MYHHNKPAITQMSHYLRTGRVLPAKYFEQQKSSGQDCRSHKGWATTDFVRHYFRGRGRAVNLADVGLLGRFQDSNSVRSAIEEFKNRQIMIGREKARIICRRVKSGDRSIIHERFSDRKNTTTDVTLDILRLFSVGRSTFFRSAQTDLYVDCAEKSIHMEGMLKFSIDDAFIDANDLNSDEPGNQEYEGGVPYKIWAKWRQPYGWKEDL